MLVVDKTAAPLVAGEQKRRGKAAKTYTAAFLTHDGRYFSRITISDLELTRPLVQPLPDSRMLIVQPRCRRFGDGTAERNARIYGPDGKLESEHVLGDGIADVQTTPDGDIWVSYFDEGIFGTHGWGDDDSEPLGKAGLVRFNSAGEKRWEYQSAKEFGLMADCYALNVDNRTTWAYYYTDFPLVRIDPNGGVEAWQTNTAGASAVAVDGRRVLFFGGYRTNRQRFQLAELGEKALLDSVDLRMLLPSGEALQDGWVKRAIGRGQHLHVFDGIRWHRVDVSGLPVD